MDINLYKKLHKELIELRIKNNGKESKEEDILLNHMDKIWSNLSQDEIDELNNNS